MLFSSRRLLQLGTAALLTLTAAGSARAANVFLNKDQASGSSWATAADWSSAAAAGAGNAYFVGRDSAGATTGITYVFDTGMQATITKLRTPTGTASVTFPGDALTIDTSGTLGCKVTQPAVVTINNLTLKGTALVADMNGTDTFTLAGLCAVSGTPTFLSTDKNRNYLVNSQLTGSGTITVKNNLMNAGAVLDATQTFFALNNDTNTYTGAFNIYDFTMSAKTANSLKTATNITLYNTSRFVAMPGFTTDASAAVLELKGANTKLELRGGLKVKKLILNGAEVPGTAGIVYTAANLATMYPNSVINSGGSVTITSPSTVPVEISGFSAE